MSRWNSGGGGDPSRRPSPVRSSYRGASGSGRASSLTVAEILRKYSAGPQSGVFTDGSCSGNPGPGGWGVVYVLDGRILASEHGEDPATTNNRMEFTAMIHGLQMLGPEEAMDVYTDSQLVVNTLTQWAAGWKRNGWKRHDGEVKNLELVREAYELFLERPRARIRWIKAHDGSLWNEYADALSTAYLRAEV